MTRNALILIAAVGLAAAILILWRGSAATEAAVQDQAVIALGQRLYAENCATCHGADLEGQPDWQTPLANGRYPAPPHDETGHTWHHADALLERIIRDGTAAELQKAWKRDVGNHGVLLRGISMCVELRSGLRVSTHMGFVELSCLQESRDRYRRGWDRASDW